ncbi:hypothetical protein [Crossiella cryophila]|uniref:Uncharacterized protein n=1 Tax=Crossiella cryophila TaxID=43355 RepID=A0A7W7CFG3_9PSEU|nr:hypothetical protein [Crossiella cryophila]MBB4678798.1 hypothetical protein [Crossiella cryophila]
MLGRLESGWWVVELGEPHFRSARHVAAFMGRSHAFLGNTVLPISEEEFQRLAAPRPDEPRAGNLTR